MKTTPHRIALALVTAAVLVVIGVVVSSRPVHPDFGPMVSATIREGRSDFQDWMAEAKSKLLGVPENRDAQRYVSLGGAPLEIGGAGPDSAWFYLNHPKLNNQPQWEMALSSRTSLVQVALEDLRCKFYGMSDPGGAAAFGTAWRGHAVRVSEGRVVFIRAMTNRSTTYAVELMKVVRGRGARPRVEVRYLSTPTPPPARLDPFLGSRAGDEREINGVKLCWCPPGRFRMGSPSGEPERRPGETQVAVALSKGFWMGKYEVTQGQWRAVVGEFPGPFTAGQGDDFPVYTVNFAEAEGFCRRLTASAHASGELPKDWEFRLPAEAQWEYACRAGTTTATSFGDKLSSQQANFQGKPYNGAEPGPSLKRTAKVGSYPPNPWGLGKAKDA